MAGRESLKRGQIDKANTVIFAAVAVAAFALTFSLVSARSLIAMQSYQNKVSDEREKARDQLDKNISAVDDLKIKYAEFVTRQENIIKGSSTGTGERDGDNARIVLDALPSKYDFPALASSLEKIMGGNATITSITGVDEEATRNSTPTDKDHSGKTTAKTATTSSSTASKSSSSSSQQGAAVEMPFTIGAKGQYGNVLALLTTFNGSIRPMKLQTVKLSAADNGSVQLDVTGVSYYQPERTLTVKEEVVK